MLIGKIVGSTSHVNYNGQVFTAQEIEVAPRPADFALGRFVRIKIRALSVTAPSGTHEERPSDEITSYAIGVIYNTILLQLLEGLTSRARSRSRSSRPMRARSE